MTLLSPNHNYAADECIAHLHIPSSQEKIRASESFDKTILVAAHQAALHDAYILEMGTHPLNASPISPVSPTSSIGGLKVVGLKQLKIGKVHRNRVLHGTLCTKSLCTKDAIGLAVVNVLEDEDGKATPIHLSNALSDNYSSAQAQRIYPQGSRVAVREPYLTRLPDGEVGLLVEKHADLVFLWVPEVIESYADTLAKKEDDKTLSEADHLALEGGNDYGNGHVVAGDNLEYAKEAKNVETEGVAATGNEESSSNGQFRDSTEKMVGESANRDMSVDKILTLRGGGDASNEVAVEGGFGEVEKSCEEGGEEDKIEDVGGEKVATEAQLKSEAANGLEEAGRELSIDDILALRGEGDGSNKVAAEGGVGEVEKVCEEGGEEDKIRVVGDEKVAIEAQAESEAANGLEEAGRELSIDDILASRGEGDGSNEGAPEGGVDEVENLREESEEDKIRMAGDEKLGTEAQAELEAANGSEEAAGEAAAELEPSERAEKVEVQSEQEPAEGAEKVGRDVELEAAPVEVLEKVEETKNAEAAAETDGGSVTVEETDIAETAVEEGREEAPAEEIKTPPWEAGETCTRLRIRGNECFARAEYKLAAEMYTRAAEKASKEANDEEQQLSLSNRAEAWLKLGRNQAALDDSEAALLILGDRRGLSFAKALFRKGRALMGLRHYDQAMGVLTQVLESAPSDRQLREAAILCRERLKHVLKPGKRRRAAASKKQQRQLPP